MWELCPGGRHLPLLSVSNFHFYFISVVSGDSMSLLLWFLSTELDSYALGQSCHVPELTRGTQHRFPAGKLQETHGLRQDP